MSVVRFHVLPTHIRVLGAIALTALLAACAPSLPIQHDPTTMPFDEASLRQLAVQCDLPEVAKERASAKFRYGCFCGRGHPDLKDSRQGREASLSPVERSELVGKYLRIRPIDSIDRACQEHDVCWTRQGREELACNQILIAELDRLRAQWAPSEVERVIPEVEARCEYMVVDMMYAFVLLGPADGTDPAAIEADRAGKLLRLPITFLYGLRTVMAGALFSNYPRAEDRCGR
jgi:hypothetical protein